MNFPAKIYKYASILKSLCYKKRIVNFFRALASYLLRRHKVKNLPFLVQIEPTNNCNLRCSLCLVGQNRLKRIKGNMSFVNFKSIIDQLEPELCYLALYNLGEPFLNPEIFKMISYAKSRNIFIRLSTHGDFKNSETIKKITESGLDELLISLDCATPSSYLSYKKSDNFKRVINNIELLVSGRKKNKKPYLVLQLLLMHDTENEIHDFKKLARGLKVDKILFKKIRINSLHTEPQKNYLPINKKYIRARYKDNFTKNSCIHPWISTVIFWDGTVAPCCFDMEGEYAFGNIHKEKLSRIWNNSAYIKFRKEISLNLNQTSLCKECSIEGITFYIRSLFF